MNEKICKLCGKDISNLHRRCIRCPRCQKLVRRLQNNTARIKRFPKSSRIFEKTLYIINKIEQGQLKINIFELDIDKIHFLHAELILDGCLEDYLNSIES